MADPIQPDADQRAEIQSAIQSGDYSRAFAAYQLSLQVRAMTLLASQAYQIEILKEPETLAALTGSMAATLERQVEEEGDQASYKLLVVRDVVVALANMHALLEQPLEQPGRKIEDVIAALLFQAVRLGTVEVEINQTLGGFLDQFAGLAWNDHQTRATRSKGASSTNQRKALKRSEALQLAQAITKTNPTLSNDELAFRLKQRGSLTFSGRTLIGWIQTWRREGLLPPRP